MVLYNGNRGIGTFHHMLNHSQRCVSNPYFTNLQVGILPWVLVKRKNSISSKNTCFASVPGFPRVLSTSKSQFGCKCTHTEKIVMLKVVQWICENMWSFMFCILNVGVSDVSYWTLTCKSCLRLTFLKIYSKPSKQISLAVSSIWKWLCVLTSSIAQGFSRNCEKEYLCWTPAEGPT